MTVPDEPLLLSTEQVADMLGISPRHVRDLLAEGVLPGVKLGHIWRVPRRALELLVERALEHFDPDTLADRLARIGQVEVAA